MASLEVNDYSNEFHDKCIESWEDPETASRDFRFVQKYESCKAIFIFEPNLKFHRPTTKL